MQLQQQINQLVDAFVVLDPVMRRVVLGIAEDEAAKARQKRPTLRLVVGGDVQSDDASFDQEPLPHAKKG